MTANEKMQGRRGGKAEENYVRLSRKLTEWLSGLSFTNEPKKYLRAQFALPPATSSGVGEVPNQRLVFPVYAPSLSREFLL